MNVCVMTGGWRSFVLFWSNVSRRWNSFFMNILVGTLSKIKINFSFVRLRFERLYYAQLYSSLHVYLRIRFRRKNCFLILVVKFAYCTASGGGISYVSLVERILWDRSERCQDLLALVSL